MPESPPPTTASLTTAEAVLLLAARQGRLRRLYYRSSQEHVDAVVGGSFGGGGGKANPDMLARLVERGWLTEPVQTDDDFEALWQVTEEGWAARAAYFAAPAKRKRYGTA